MIVYRGRASGGITEHKGRYAHEHKDLTDLTEIVKAVKPTVLIGKLNKGEKENGLKLQGLVSSWYAL